MPLKSEKNNPRRRTNYFEIDNDYVKSYARHLGVVATAVYTSLCMHADYETGRSWPSMELIAEQHGLERHAISRALNKLEGWNIIKIGKAIDRKNRKRKNNVYTLVQKEYWKAIPQEDGGIINTVIEGCHGIEGTVDMVSKVPQYGTQDTSNKTQLIIINKQETYCGQEPTIYISPPLAGEGETEADSLSVVEVSDEDVWNCNQEIGKLLHSDYIDYRVIGYYFYFKTFSFDNKENFDMAFKRALKPAQKLKEYKKGDIGKSMEWCKDSYGETVGWTLETVVKRIDDCIANDFTPQESKKWDRLSDIGTRPPKGKYANISNK